MPPFFTSFSVPIDRLRHLKVLCLVFDGSDGVLVEKDVHSVRESRMEGTSLWWLVPLLNSKLIYDRYARTYDII